MHTGGVALLSHRLMADVPPGRQYNGTLPRTLDPIELRRWLLAAEASVSHLSARVPPQERIEESHIADAASIRTKIKESRGLHELSVTGVNRGRGFLSGNKRLLRAIVDGLLGWRGSDLRTLTPRI